MEIFQSALTFLVSIWRKTEKRLNMKLGRNAWCMILQKKIVYEKLLFELIKLVDQTLLLCKILMSLNTTSPVKSQKKS